MKKYIKPEMEIDQFEAEDIITSSGGEGAGGQEQQSFGDDDF